MIEINKLTEKDIGRNMIYCDSHCQKIEVGQLSSWNDNFVFVRFKGLTGEACDPRDISFEVGGYANNN